MFEDLNRNVKSTLIFTFVQALGRGIWLGNVLSAFIFFLADESHTLLGWVSASTGLAMTLIVFPAGAFADKYRRDWVLKDAMIFGILGLGVMFFATSIVLVFIALIFWGLFQGMVQPSLEAIFADSIASGRRSGLYATKHLLQQLGMAFGPAINIALFVYLGDKWELSILQKVMWVGLSISFLSLMVLAFFNDGDSMGQESDAFKQEDESSTLTSSKSVPYIVVLSNLIIGVGAGMTIRYFPIFFYEIYDMAPVLVNLIMGGSFVLTGLFGLLTQRYSLEKGRPLAIFLVQSIAILCLFFISFYPPMTVLIVLFLMRGALMNASQPLSRSILMDYIPKKNRGKWNSVQAIAWGLFWNTSVVIGGYLIELYDYSLTFRITALVYTVGTLPILLLVPLVKNEDLAPIKSGYISISPSLSVSND